MTIYTDSNIDKSLDLGKLPEVLLRYLKHPFFAYVNIHSLRNKVIDLKLILQSCAEYLRQALVFM